MIVAELPSPQQTALRNLVNDVGAIYSSISQEYLEHWETISQTEQLPEDCPDVVLQVEPDFLHDHVTNTIQAPGSIPCTHVQKCVYVDPLYSRYYCVITQYVKPVNITKLINFARELKNKEISKKYYNFRLADPEVSLSLTGYKKGGVCPVGMIQPVPVILAESITKLEPPVIYLGAGHIDWKLGVPVQAFIDATKCMVADLE
ncbi:hypothetical protein DFQ28_011332 [Apophysomyces sp. BC1034]|nr:hypothetical protein DFQ28_011332 [Apophysomyces sp. BC1034]